MVCFRTADVKFLGVLCFEKGAAPAVPGPKNAVLPFWGLFKAVFGSCESMCLKSGHTMACRGESHAIRCHHICYGGPTTPVASTHKFMAITDDPVPCLAGLLALFREEVRVDHRHTVVVPMHPPPHKLSKFDRLPTHAPPNVARSQWVDHRPPRKLRSLQEGRNGGQSISAS
jgi:hypothetical protein